MARRNVLKDQPGNLILIAAMLIMIPYLALGQISFSPPGCDFTVQIPDSATVGEYTSANDTCKTRFASLSAHDRSTELSIECTLCSTYDPAVITQSFAFQAQRNMAKEMGWEIIAQSFETQSKMNISYLRASSRNGGAGIFLQTFFGHQSYLSVRIEAASEDFAEAFRQTMPILETIDISPTDENAHKRRQ